MSFKSKFGAGLKAAAALTVLLSTAAPAAAESTAAPFVDVSKSYMEAVNYLVDHDIASGITTTQFGISHNIKRGDAAIILANALGLTEAAAPASGFIDVPKRGEAAISALKKAGIVSGKSNTHFGFNDLLKRGEIALMLTKAAAYNLKGDVQNVQFIDVNSRYLEAVAGLVDNGVTSGKSTALFGTDEQLKRGEYAIFIHRAEKIQEEREKPVLEYTGETSFTVVYGSEFILPNVSVTDNQDAAIEATYEIRYGSQEVTAIDTTAAGVYTITYRATDDSGRPAEPLMLTVTVAAETELAKALKAAQQAIGALPAIDTLTTADGEAIQAARDLVEAVYALDEQTAIEQLDKLEAAEAKLAELIEQETIEEAIAAATAAIAALPEAAELTIEDRTDVFHARELASAAYALDPKAWIEGLDKLVALETKMEQLLEEAAIQEAIAQAESAIAALPYLDVMTYADKAEVENARAYVNAALQLKADAAIDGLEVLAAAEAKIKELYKPELRFNTYASITINSRIDAISTSFYNLSSDTVTVEQLEIISGTSSKSVYTKDQLNANGISTTIARGQQFGISVTFLIGIWATSENYVKYTVSDGTKTYEYISYIN